MPPESKPAELALQGRCDQCGSVPGHAGDGSALRCNCGSLLARYTDLGLELKCRRCKRTVIVRTDKARSESAIE